MARRALSSLMAAVLAVIAPACGNALPGTMLGTYKVSAQSQTNTCGLSAPDPWVFDVQLSNDNQTLYWSWMDGSAPLYDPLASNSATLTDSVESNVDGTDAGAGPCTMTRDDSLLVDLGSGSPPGSFSGTITYNFTVAAGADCADQLSNAGGQYDTLPCTIVYSMSATRQ